MMEYGHRRIGQRNTGVFEYELYGLQRSGTNYFSDLMKLNFSSELKNTLDTKVWTKRKDYPDNWKHNLNCVIETDAPVFVIYKNPYTWIESICFRDSVDWVKRQTTYPPVCPPKNMQLGKKKINILSLANSYKHWCDNWLDKGFYEIKYEDLLLEDTRNCILSNIAETYSLPITETWKNVPAGKVSQSKNFSENTINYYIKTQSEKLNSEHITELQKIIDSDLMARLGYTYE